MIRGYRIVIFEGNCANAPAQPFHGAGKTLIYPAVGCSMGHLPLAYQFGSLGVGGRNVRCLVIKELALRGPSCWAGPLDQLCVRTSIGATLLFSAPSPPHCSVATERWRGDPDRLQCPSSHSRSLGAGSWSALDK